MNKFIINSNQDVIDNLLLLKIDFQCIESMLGIEFELSDGTYFSDTDGSASSECVMNVYRVDNHKSAEDYYPTYSNYIGLPKSFPCIMVGFRAQGDGGYIEDYKYIYPSDFEKE